MEGLCSAVHSVFCVAERCLKKSKPLIERYENFVNRFRFSSLEKAEARIRDKTSGETVVAFDAQGKYLFSLSSPTPRIVFRTEETERMKGAVVTHNHPAGTPFGDTDIKTACEAQVREMRVVTGEYTFSMQPPPTGWDAALWTQVVNPARVEAEIAAARGLRKQLDTFTSENEYHAALLDRTWQEVANRTGIVYNKRRR